MKVERPDLVMALYPNARGFAYVIFEGASCPVDWGMCDVLHKEGRVSACVRCLSILIDRYRPEYLVLREVSDARASTARIVVEAAEKRARRNGVKSYRLSRKDIREALAPVGSSTRYAIAQAIAKDIPTFAPLLPSARRIWNGEDRRMGLFDAAALALAFLAMRRERGLLFCDTVGVGAAAAEDAA